MFCGVLELTLIDTAYGTPRHGVHQFQAVCIGTEVIEINVDTGHEEIFVVFTAEFNMYNKWSKCKLDYKESITGYLYVKTIGDTFMLANTIVTFIAPNNDEIKRALDNKDNINGIGLLEFTKDFNSSPIDITYHIVHNNTDHFIKKVEFCIPKDRLTETQKVLHELSVSRVEQI